MLHDNLSNNNNAELSNDDSTNGVSENDKIHRLATFLNNNPTIRVVDIERLKLRHDTLNDLLSSGYFASTF